MEETSGFLAHFDRKYRGRNSNFFYSAIRDGEQEPRAICSLVYREVTRRAKRPYDEEQGRSLNELLHWLREDQAGALEFAERCLAWENATPEERRERKARAGEEGKREWMRGQPPTEKQLAVLQKLGHVSEVPNRLAASELIEKLKTW